MATKTPILIIRETKQKQDEFMRPSLSNKCQMEYFKRIHVQDQIIVHNLVIFSTKKTIIEYSSSDRVR